MKQTLLKLLLQLTIIIIVWMIAGLLHASLLTFLPRGFVGLTLMLAILYSKILPFHYVSMGANFLLSHMILLFIPSTIGLIEYKDLILTQGVKIMVISIISPILMFFIVGHIVEWLYKLEKSWKQPS